MHIPHCFEKTVEAVDCVELVGNNTKNNIPQCWCFNTTKENLVCSYFGHNIEGLHDTIIWKTYVVLCELMVRFGPALLLIGLNVAMIRHFNNVISASNAYLTPPNSKPNLPTIRIFTVENETKSQISKKAETSFLMEPNPTLAALHQCSPRHQLLADWPYPHQPGHHHHGSGGVIALLVPPGLAGVAGKCRRCDGGSLGTEQLLPLLLLPLGWC